MEMEKDAVISDDLGLHPSTLEQKDPWFITYLFSFITELLSNYGWYFLSGVVIIFYLKKKLKAKFESWQLKRNYHEESAEYHKDPDKFIAREQKLQESRLQLQMRYDERVRENIENEKQRQEAKRQQCLKLLEQQDKVPSTQNVGDSKEKTPTKAKPKLQPEFNPLMSGGGSQRWRPARKGGSAGG